MQQKTLREELTIYDNMEELVPEDMVLVQKAIEFLDLSYAPYSNFHVAAALRLENGEIISGANQENASYPLCLCAERVALHHAAMRFPKVKIQAMAITARNPNKSDMGPIPPCGACRQVIAEYEKLLDCDIRILLKGDKPQILELNSISQVLPLGFDSDFLG